MVLLIVVSLLAVLVVAIVGSPFRLRSLSPFVPQLIPGLLLALVVRLPVTSVVWLSVVWLPGISIVPLPALPSVGVNLSLITPIAFPLSNRSIGYRLGVLGSRFELKFRFGHGFLLDCLVEYLLGCLVTFMASVRSLPFSAFSPSMS
jgi:hypothetical protein